MTFENRTPLPLGAYLLSDTGSRLGMVPGDAGRRAVDVGYPPVPVPPLGTTAFQVGPALNGWYFVLVNAATGAFVDVRSAYVKQEGGECRITVTPRDLCAPNAIGKPPRPNRAVVIPTDSARVTVGCGALRHEDNRVALEQYWRRLPQSYSLGPQEERVVSYTTTSGMDTTTSEQRQVAASVGLDASVGWGPISASVSASLDLSSSTSQQVNVRSQTTSFVSESFENKHDTTKLILLWELTTVATIFGPEGTALASIVYGSEDPAVIGGPYDIDHLDPRPLDKAEPMSQDMRAILSGDRALT
ncbi:hypothetical protein [Streptomyces sp. B6B3]|uniref:hypothetical protein n=1 Tax=Streptomyces sp. B6B3 TaxID=3153570 RepID=UPI00325E53B6